MYASFWFHFLLLFGMFVTLFVFVVFFSLFGVVYWFGEQAKPHLRNSLQTLRREISFSNTRQKLLLFKC